MPASNFDDEDERGGGEFGGGDKPQGQIRHILEFKARNQVISNFKLGESYADNEYYHFLNVPRDAEDSQISAAYKRLSRLYHPDKHRDEESKKKAEVLFAKLKRAHEGEFDSYSRESNI